MPAAPSVSAVIDDAAWLAHRYDPDHDAFHFRRVSRSARMAVPFLTDQHLGEEASPLVLRRADCTATNGPRRAPIHFLFHSAYCASTMLAHVLDQPGVATTLSEPVLLNDMIGWRRRGADPRMHGRVMDDALAMLGRGFAAGEAVVVKPSNIFNPLARGVLLLRPQARAILLHAPLRAFLLSVARKGLWCRLWCRELFENYLADGFVRLAFGPHDYFRQSDLQVAAIGWLAQQQAFAALLDWAPDRIASLDSETLTRDPVAAIAAAMDHLGLAVDRGAIADHPSLVRNSKSGAAFAPGERQRDLAAAERAYGEEIAQVVGWAEAVADQAAIPMTLPGALAAR
ncbi:hypothetical protein [Sphingopyxis alaskensis]|jgi:hypothetical protein|uniref:Sulfotransferase family protein n=1 Tax=Sphingopyxis alaskensis (strain DSM 13593 / LMG 18877 / RB2256) TaxID=317655 RepID=Q1GNF9_SPHAL|nr:hypothetical protein [Sphingopyxis alaskensis]ABF54813.1 hypothetical protein Sala_3109 [Sphingopyxis alaskensis RB2256]